MLSVISRAFSFSQVSSGEIIIFVHFLNYLVIGMQL